MESHYIGFAGIRGSTMSWRDLQWGLEQGLINHEDVVRFSDSTLDASDALADQLHLNLSTCYIEDALNAIVNAHNASVDISLWQYLVLRHVYINMDSYQDPLD